MKQTFSLYFEKASLLVALLSVFAFVIVYYPGGMITDSVNQLEQVRGGWFADWHPPFMAWLWRGMEYVAKGPLLMLLAQVLLFFSAVWHIGLSLFRGTRAGAALLVLSAVLILPLSGVIGVIWKDAWSTAILAWAVVFLIKARDRDTGRELCLGAALVCCIAAMLFRHNALFAVFPLVCWGVSLSRPSHMKARGLWVLSLGVSISLAGFMFANLVNSRLTTTKTYPEQSILLFDIAGIAATSGSPEGIEQLSEQAPSLAADGVTIDANRVVEMYRPSTWTDLVFDQNSPMRTTSDEGVRDAILSVWMEQIARHPGAYLRHRADVFCEVLALNDSDLFAPTAFSISKKHAIYEFVRRNYGDIVESYPPAPFRVKARNLIFEATRSWLYRPWLWFGCFVPAAAVLAVKRETRSLAIALGASAMCSESMLFFIAPSADFRYSHWMIFVAWYFLIVVVAGFLRRR